MPNLCKKHGKPKTEIWDEKQKRGGSLTRIGCVDCKADAARKPKPTATAALAAANVPETTPQSKTLAERFGFKF